MRWALPLLILLTCCTSGRPLPLARSPVAVPVQTTDPVTTTTSTTTTTEAPPPTTSRPPARPRPTVVLPPPRPAGPRASDFLTCGQAAQLVMEIAHPNGGSGCGAMVDPAHDKAETIWYGDGTVTVTFRVDRCCTRGDALHEAAHVLAGVAADHGPDWLRVYDDLLARYTVGP